MSRKNIWRNTSRTERFFIFDAKAGIPFFLFLAHISWWTFTLAALSFVVFGMLERFGFSLKIALRLCRAWLAGPFRYPARWERNKR